jgi:hypothetical protein
MQDPVTGAQRKKAPPKSVTPSEASAFMAKVPVFIQANSASRGLARFVNVTLCEHGDAV